MIFISRLLLILTAMALTNAWPWSGLNICDTRTCHLSIDRPTLNTTLGTLAVPTACANLVGSDGSLSYVADERRHVCYQAVNGDGAYRFDYDVHRNKGSDLANTLDFHSCRDAMLNLLGNGIWCFGDPGTQEYNVGQRMQVGLFDVYASPQPGLCAGTLEYVV